MLRSLNKIGVTVLLPPELINYLTLYSIGESLPRTKVIEGVIVNWHKGTSKSKPEKELINRIKHCLKVEWTAEKTKGGGEGFEPFIARYKVYLSNKGLSEEQIQQIITIEQ